MSDVIDLETERMAKALGMKPGSLMVAICDGDEWKRWPLKYPVAMANAVSNLGLKTGTDWPRDPVPGDPYADVSTACQRLGEALELIRKAVTEAPPEEEGTHHTARTLGMWVQSLEATMRMIHATATQTYRLAKAEREADASKRLSVEVRT